VLSKPVTRPAFILTKLAANVIGALVLIVGLPGLIAYIEVYLYSKIAIPVLPFIAGLGVILIGLVFYLTLTLMLGTLFEQRGALLGIAVAVFLGGMIMANFIPQVGYILPLNIHQISNMVAFQQPLPPLAVSQLFSSVGFSLVFTLVALLRFGQEEL
jgi:ABC-2 type transport system permease protein